MADLSIPINVRKLCTMSAKSPLKSKGALSNPASRFAVIASDYEGDMNALPVTLQVDHAKTIITKNQSPDVPFEQSINPYQGCEHGCIYCFARPTHNYWDLSAGLDFESHLFYKPAAAELLVKALAKPKYRCQTIAMGTNTDPYQPIEKTQRITRKILEVLLRCRHPVSIVTKGALILRDLDILSALARLKLVSVMVSVTTLDTDLKTIMEPRAAVPATRLKIIRSLYQEGIPVGVLTAPIIPRINDHEMESILAAAKEAGADRASYLLLRLPYGVKDLFSEWLHAHFPDRAEHVLNLLRASRRGKLNDARFNRRMTGEGPFADLIYKRFRLACRRYGINRNPSPSLRTDLFVPLTENSRQLSLFDA